MLNKTTSLDQTFQALADPTRRAMVERLSRGPASVSELAEPLAMSLPSVMQHLQVLESSGLIRSEKVGRVRTCRIEAEQLSLAEQWINARRRAWDTRLDRLDDYLKTLPPKETIMANDDRAAHQNIEAHSAAKARIPEVPTRTVAHGSFSLERTYEASVARVWKALTEQGAKDKWFGGPATKFEVMERAMDMRVGGRERLKGRWIEGGVVSTFDALYYDVIPNERLVYAYEMHIDERKISVSLATMELRVEGAKTRLLVTEQGAFLDGYDDAGSRESGTNHLLDAIGASLTG